MSKFWRILLVIVAVAFGIRVMYVAVAKNGPCTISLLNGRVTHSPSACAVGDQLFYNSEANYVADGHGFNEPLAAVLHPGSRPGPAADHPPLTVFVLTPVSWLADHPPLSWVMNDEPVNDHVREHRYTMVVLGTINVLLIGLLGRRAARDVTRLPTDATALVAAGIAAVNPNAWVNDGLVMSETITVMTVIGALLCAYALRDRPTLGRAAALGAVCGLAILARVEMALLVVLLGVVLPFTVKPRTTGRGTLVAGALVASVIVVAPWVGFNLERFHDTTLVSTNDGLALLGANCDATYSGPGMGLWLPGACPVPAVSGDQSQQSSAYRSQAVDYIKAHKPRVPLVALARVGRTWGLFRPSDMIDYNTGEGRERWVTRLGMVVYYPVLIAAIAGAVVLWRRRSRVELWVLLAPVLAVTITSAITYGQTRFRAAAEPSLAVLAAVAAVALVVWLAERRSDADRRTRVLVGE